VRGLEEPSRIALSPETVKQLQEASRVAVSPETIKRLQEASRVAVSPETVKQLQEASRVAVSPETIKRLQEASRVAVSPETIKRLQEASRVALDPETLRQLRATLAVPLSQLRSLSDGVAGQLEPDHAVTVASFANELGDAKQLDSADLVSEWLLSLGTARQRRLLLLGLAALSAVLDAVDAEAKVQMPGHLSLIIYALIAIALLLNETIDGTDA
jgi:Asp-tRNA(Asn)/Glu-tRNA(Gln) amidotransferase C subunit